MTNATATRYTYTVKTRDVDGSTRKTFKSLAGARKRFEEMCGLTLEQVLLDQQGDGHQAADQIARLEGVSSFGTVVTLSRKVQGEATDEAAEVHAAEVDLAQNPDAPEHQADAPAEEPQAEVDAKAVRAAQREADHKAKAEAKETAKAQRLAKLEAEREAKAAVARVKKAEAEAAAYLGRAPEQNGIKAPRSAGSIASAWALLDELHAAGQTIYGSLAAAEAAKAGLNVGNMMVEVSRWRRFNGIANPGRAPVAKVETSKA